MGLCATFCKGRSSGHDRRMSADLRTITQVTTERPWITERYLRRLIFERRVPYYKIGRRVLVSLSELDQLVAEGRVGH
jgi:excisionase family DNA binding protein